MRILFYIPESNIFANGVYASQCLELGRYMVQTHGAECIFVQYAPDGESEIQLEHGITVLNDTVRRGYIPIFSQPRFYKKIAKRFEKRILAFNPTHIYCRQYQTVAGGCQLHDSVSGCKVIYSIRGEDVSERQGQRGLKNYLVSLWIRYAVRSAIRMADHINTVSKSFKTWLKQEYGCESSVVPCCVAQRFFEISPLDREIVRNELGFSINDKVIVFCGGMWPWLCVDDMVRWMRNICEISAEVKVLFIVKDEDSVREVCERNNFPVSRWRVRGCAPEVVGRYLRAADIGIIFLRGELRDRVCSPVKVGEYLASGLGVIAPACTGDFATEAENKPFFYEYSSANSLSTFVTYLQSITDETRAEARQFAKGRYTWQANDTEISRMFG